jgi:glycosyltransferase involved in cell wall biosynthesis
MREAAKGTIDMSYSIVIPARNEEQTVGEVLENVRHFTDDLLVIDGHSTVRFPLHCVTLSFKPNNSPSTLHYICRNKFRQKHELSPNSAGTFIAHSG